MIVGVFINSSNVKVTVDGAIIAPKYIVCDDNTTLSISDVTTPTTKAGYRTYTASPTSTVWVKDGPVCVMNCVEYATIDAAIAAVPTGGATPSVIKLLRNISQEITSENYYKYRISNKKITFDLNGFDLIFTGHDAAYLEVINSVINYTGIGEFKIKRNLNMRAGAFFVYALSVSGGGSCTLTGVEITNYGAACLQTAIYAVGGDIVVNGDVKATGNGNYGVGIDAQRSNITVKGNIIAGDVGVYVHGINTTTVTVDGFITAPRYIWDGYETTLGISDVTTPTTKPGYLTYTLPGSASTVWVQGASTVQAKKTVCQIGTTDYYSIETAINAVPTGGAMPTVIKLLDNITHELSCPYYGYISYGKKITFDLNGFNLIFTGSPLIVTDGSIVNYTGTGEFKVINSINSSEDGTIFDALVVMDGSSCTLTGVEITDNGTGTNRRVIAISSINRTSPSCTNTVVVNGDVKATGNGSADSGGWGISTNGIGVSSNITVKGNIIADGIGVCIYQNNATVTVDGTITAPKYIEINGTTLSSSNVTTPTTKPDYLTYTLGTNTVWVKDIFVSVSNIKDVPRTATVNLPLTLTGTVEPSNAANQTIVWTVQNAGTTGATISGNTLNTTGTGTVVVRATIANGTATGDYTQDFTITVNPYFFAVDRIIDIPAIAALNLPLTLTGTVEPSNASKQSIVWSITDAGTTNATLAGNIFTASTEGTATLLATIKDGTAAGVDYTQQVSITVIPPVCQIGSTFYSTIEAAIEAVPADDAMPTVIKLLDNITHELPKAYSMYRIDNKKITFYLDGFDLIFTENCLSLDNGSIVDYIGSGELKVIRNLTGTAIGVNTSALSIENGSSCTLTEVEITDNGTGIGRNVVAIKSNNASVTVNGDVKTTSNRDITANSWGIDANSSAITVTGNITCDNIGVYVRNNTTVTIDGSIDAPLYIMIDGNVLSISEFTKPTTKTGYFTYKRGTSTVWVKDGGTGISTVSLSKTAAIIGYCDLLGRKLQTEPTKGIYIILYDNGTAKKVMR